MKIEKYHEKKESTSLSYDSIRVSRYVVELIRPVSTIHLILTYPHPPKYILGDFIINKYGLLKLNKNIEVPKLILTYC